MIKYRAEKTARVYNKAISEEGEDPPGELPDRPKGVLVMTVMMIFAAVMIANIAFSIYDNRQAEVDRQIDDFYRVEDRRCTVGEVPGGF